EDFLGIGDFEIIFLAKNVAVFRVLSFRHARQHFMNDQRDILLLGVTKFLRYGVRAKKCRNELDWAFRVESSNYAQKFQFVLDRQAVTRLRFNRRRSIS